MNKLILDPHQRSILNEMIRHSRYAVFMPTGSGKTLTTLEALKFNSLTHCLIIAPRLVISNAWLSELKKWRYPFTWHELKGKNLELNRINWGANLFFTTPESLTTKRFLSFFDLFKKRNLCQALIVDESSKFKNTKACRTRNLMKWSKDFEYCYLLSATPAPRSLLNLWPQFYMIDQGVRLEKTLTKYRKKYFKQVPPYEFYKYEIAAGSDKIIYKKIEDKAKSVKAEYLQKFRYQNHLIPCSIKTKLKLKDLKNNIMRDDVIGSAVVVQKTAIKLLQIGGGACYLTDDDGTTHKSVFCNEKIKYLTSFIENLQGNPVLIACNYHIEIERIAASLTNHLVDNFSIITGGMRRENVDDIVDRWNKKSINVLIVQASAISHGINMQHGGNQIVWFSAPLDLEIYEQLNGRLNRKGQKNTVFIHHLITEHTADGIYFDAIENKSSVQKALIEYLKI